VPVSRWTFARQRFTGKPDVIGDVVNARNNRRTAVRAIIFILIIAVVAIIAALATGMIDINTIRGAQAPTVTATANGVSATGGQAPAFEVETGSVAVGKGATNVAVPKLTIEKGQTEVSVPKVEVRRAGDQNAVNAAQ
jgi:hypothetical protein